MILILTDSDDTTTTIVINYLEYYKKKWIRINHNDKLEFEFLADDIKIKLLDIDFKLSQITSYWYRRGFFDFDLENLDIKELDLLLKKEYFNIIEFIHYKLNGVHHLDSIKNERVNKLIVSDIARKIGICTPNDFLISKKEALKEIFKNYKGEFITKSISGESLYSFEEFLIANYTTKLNLKSLKENDFFPSLLQNYIEKKYELRIFYLKGVFYSMAIFSQSDKQTSTDFRIYNREKPNRYVPYNLPKEIELKIDALMKKLDLNSGSIDMIVTQNNKFVFLEVNPVGQFGMVSYPCNYDIEKKIAKYLINEK